jgi:hypothetical protein
MLTLMKPTSLLIPLMLLVPACQADQGPLKLKEGETAPDFTLPSGHGGRVSLGDYRGERAVLLYFSMGPG